MSKRWRKFRKVRLIARIIGQLAYIFSDIYYLSENIYELKTGKRPKTYED